MLVEMLVSEEAQGPQWRSASFRPQALLLVRHSSYPIQTHFKWNLSLFKWIAGPCTAMLKAGIINHLQSSSIVSWSFYCLRASRDNVILTLSIITMINCFSVPMPAPTTCWVSEQSSSVSTQSQCINQYQLIIKLAVVIKITFSSDF